MAEDLVVNVRVQGTNQAKGQIESLGTSASKTGKLAGMAMGPLDAVMGGLPSKFKAAKAGVTSLNLGFKGMKAAIASTGIGLLVVAVGELVANWDSISGYLTSASSETQKQVDLAREYAIEAQNALDAIIRTENTLRLQGKSEEEILALKMAATDEQISAQKIAIENLQKQKKEQIEAAKMARTATMAIIGLMSVPLMALLGTIDLISEGLVAIGVLSEGTNLTMGYLGGYADFLGFDVDEVAEEGQAAIDEAEKTLETLENQRDGYQLRKNRMDKEAKDKEDREAERAASDRKARREKERAALQAQMEAEERVRQELAKARMDDRQKEEANIKAHYAKLAEDAAENAELVAKVEEQREADLNAMRERFRKEDEANAEAARQKAFDADQEAKAKKLADDKAALEAEMSLRTEYAGNTFAILSNLNAAFSKKGEEQSKRSFERTKQISIAETLVSTYLSAQAAFASQFKPLATIDSPVRGALAAAAAVAGGLARVSAIRSQQYNGGSGSTAGATGGAFSGGGTQSVGVDVGTLVPTAGQPTPQPVRAYVVSNEISNQQALDRELQIQTTL